MNTYDSVALPHDENGGCYGSIKEQVHVVDNTVWRSTADNIIKTYFHGQSTKFSWANTNFNDQNRIYYYFFLFELYSMSMKRTINLGLGSINTLSDN